MKTARATPDSLRVCCRVRPLNVGEGGNAGPSCLHFPEEASGDVNNIQFQTGESHAEGASSSVTERYTFFFSRVFRPLATQQDIYHDVALPVVRDVMAGYNGTIFVFGQTGGGKTYTLFGKMAKWQRRHPLPELVSRPTPRGHGRLFDERPAPSSLPTTGRRSSSRNTRAGTFHGYHPHQPIKPSPREAVEEDEDEEEEEEEESLILRPSPSVLAADGAVGLAANGGGPERDRAEAEELTGIATRAVKDIFHCIERADASMEFEVRLFFVEVYMEEARDLLDATSRKRLSVRENVGTGSFYVEGCHMPYVTSAAEVLALVRAGLRRRAIAETAMNTASSRSHGLLNLTVKSTHRERPETKVGKLFLVDLAGSEKVSRTRSEGQRLEEAKLINKSLSALSLVIAALAERAVHIPYRDSVLTKLLKDSLGGNSRTSLIICCSPSAGDAAETLSTLRFGARAKHVENRAIVNRELSIGELRMMLAAAEEEIRRLHQRSPATPSLGDPSAAGPSSPASPVEDMLQGWARERLRVGELESEVGLLRDTLRTTREAVAALQQERDEQREGRDRLEEEVRLWAEEYAALRQRHATALRLAGAYGHAVRDQQAERQRLIQQLEHHRSTLSAALHAWEAPQPPLGLSLERCRTLWAIGTACTRPDEGDTAAAMPVSASACRRVSSSAAAAAEETSASPADRLLSSSMHAVQEALVAAARPGASLHVSSSTRRGPLSSAVARRISELETMVEELDSHLRSQRSLSAELVVSLQLAEKKLNMRQERIQDLKLRVQQEEQANKELGRIIRESQENHQHLLLRARGETRYWRAQYETKNPPSEHLEGEDLVTVSTPRVLHDNPARDNTETPPRRLLNVAVPIHGGYHLAHEGPP